MDDLILCSQSMTLNHNKMAKNSEKNQTKNIKYVFISYFRSFLHLVAIFLQQQITYALFAPTKRNTEKKGLDSFFFFSFRFSNENYRIIIGNHFDIIEKGVAAAAAATFLFFSSKFYDGLTRQLAAFFSKSSKPSDRLLYT